MAAQGRGPDRTLVHMSPKEVQGLQALAMAHGGSLTINPETGLPEAGFLENILPAVAGFALDAFFPGAGEAVGGLFGLEGAAASQLGSALTVGGISGLASGSLEKGIMAGMGAYGGAGLAQSMIGSGTGSLASAAESASGPVNATKLDAAMNTGPSATVDRLGALKTGASSAFDSPRDFLKDNKMNLALLAAPILMDSFGNKDTGPEANPSPGYIRTMKRDPVTGRIYQESAIPTGEFGNRSVGTYGGVPARGMADGGEVLSPMTEEQRLNSIATETNNPNSQVAYDTRTDSQKALAYLMGEPGSVNPMLFTHNAPTEPIQPADFATRTGGHYVLNAATNTYTWIPDAAAPVATGLDALNNQNRGGGGREVDPKEKARIDAFMDAEDAKDLANGDPVGTTRGERIKNDLGFLNMFNPLGGVMSAVDGFKGFMDPRDTSNQGFGAQIGRTLGGIFNMGPGYESGPNSRMSAVGLANLAGNPPTQTPADAETNAINDSARAYQAALNEGMRGETGGSYSGVDSSGRSDGPNGPEGRGDPGGDRGGWGSGGGYAHGGNVKPSKFYKNGKFNFQPAQVYADGGIAALAGGGLGSLGGYSDGGQLLRGPGDGVSDSIPARIGRNQPARLANNEFVIPARIVSELGNGSTDAGAKALYKMMDRVQAGRKKSIGKGKIAVDSKAVKHLPA